MPPLTVTLFTPGIILTTPSGRIIPLHIARVVRLISPEFPVPISILGPGEGVLLRGDFSSKMEDAVMHDVSANDHGYANFVHGEVSSVEAGEGSDSDSDSASESESVVFVLDYLTDTDLITEKSKDTEKGKKVSSMKARVFDAAARKVAKAKTSVEKFVRKLVPGVRAAQKKGIEVWFDAEVEKRREIEKGKKDDLKVLFPTRYKDSNINAGKETPAYEATEHYNEETKEIVDNVGTIDPSFGLTTEGKLSYYADNSQTQESMIVYTTHGLQARHDLDDSVFHLTLHPVPWEVKAGLISKETCQKCLETQRIDTILNPCPGFEYPIPADHYTLEWLFRETLRVHGNLLDFVDISDLKPWKKWYYISARAKVAFMAEMAAEALCSADRSQDDYPHGYYDQMAMAACADPLPKTAYHKREDGRELTHEEFFEQNRQSWSKTKAGAELSK